MKIVDFDLDQRVLIVAEIGNNHEGDFEVAQKMVEEAAKCGVDAVKFQTFKTEHYVNRADTARFERLKSFELTYSEFEELSNLARSQGLIFVSTPFDLASASFLSSIVDSYKIASGDNAFYPLMEKVALTGKPMIVSTGISNAEQVEKTVDFIKQTWAHNNIIGQLAILHCVSSYPVPSDQANLRSIQFLIENFEDTIGYSDHTLGIEAAILATALGAKIIEKHFTLDKNFSDFRDHQLSADPPEMRDLVKQIRLTSSMLGENRKQVENCEEGLVIAIRRSIVAGRDMSAGHYVDTSDLTWLRPSGGLIPGKEKVLIGKRLKREVSFGEQLSVTDVELG